MRALQNLQTSRPMSLRHRKLQDKDSSQNRDKSQTCRVMSDDYKSPLDSAVQLKISQS